MSVAVCLSVFVGVCGEWSLLAIMLTLQRKSQCGTKRLKHHLTHGGNFIEKTFFCEKVSALSDPVTRCSWLYNKMHDMTALYNTWVIQCSCPWSAACGCLATYFKEPNITCIMSSLTLGNTSPCLSNTINPVSIYAAIFKYSYPDSSRVPIHFSPLFH